MTKSEKNLFKIRPQYCEITSQIFIIFRLPPFHLKQERKLVYAIMTKHHAIFQSFLLEMLGFIHSFMTGNFNLKLSSGFEVKAILTYPMEFYLYLQ